MMVMVPVKNEWYEVTNTEQGGSAEITKRLAVPGGWLYRTVWWERKTPTSPRRSVRMTTVFVADAR